MRVWDEFETLLEIALTGRCWETGSARRNAGSTERSAPCARVDRALLARLSRWLNSVGQNRAVEFHTWELGFGDTLLCCRLSLFPSRRLSLFVRLPVGVHESTVVLGCYL